MEGYFPSLIDQFVSLGAGYGDVSDTARWFHEGACHQPTHSGVNALIVAAARVLPRGGVLLSQEGNRWILTIAAYLGEQIPLDQAGLYEFVRGMTTPALYDVMKGARPVGDPVPHKIPSNLRWRYVGPTRFPAGYLVMDDALCSFNPIYGQGMALAALEARALGTCLAEGEAKLAPCFFKQASEIIDIPWSTAVGNDLRFPEIEGPRTAIMQPARFSA